MYDDEDGCGCFISFVLVVALIIGFVGYGVYYNSLPQPKTPPIKYHIERTPVPDNCYYEEYHTLVGRVSVLRRDIVCEVSN